MPEFLLYYVCSQLKCMLFAVIASLNANLTGAFAQNLYYEILLHNLDDL